ncbi:MAG: type VI secretion system tube protein Hcp [Gemmatimonadales bacterium]
MTSRVGRSFIIVAACMALPALATAQTALAQENAGRVKVKMPNVRAASGYMKLGDIKGESQNVGHEDWIDVLSVDWGDADPAGSTSRVGGRREVVIVRHVDKASPQILQKIANGERFPAIDLVMPEARAVDETNDEEKPLYVVKLKSARITSYQVNATNDLPMETITLTYEEIKRSHDVILKGKKILEN